MIISYRLYKHELLLTYKSKDAFDEHDTEKKETEILYLMQSHEPQLNQKKGKNEKKKSITSRAIQDAKMMIEDKQRRITDLCTSFHLHTYSSLQYHLLAIMKPVRQLVFYTLQKTASTGNK